MPVLLMVLYVLVLIASLVGTIWLLIIAWRVGLLWFFACLCLPFASIVFAVLYPEARRPLVLSVILPMVAGLCAGLFPPDFARLQERSRQATTGPSSTDAPAEPEASPSSVRGDPNEPPPAIAATKCQVDSTPPGADILIDGKPTGSVTPATVTLWAGRNNVLTVRHAGYFQASATINPNLNQDTRRHFTLKQSASMRVKSAPDGAEVLVDGAQVIARTPGQAEAVDLGEHEVLVRKPGHVVVRRLVQVEAGKTLELDVTLPTAAFVRVRSLPSPAKIFVDGEPTGLETPAEVAVAAGEKHVIEVRRLMHLPGRQKVAPLEGGDRDQITIPLEAANRAALQERLKEAQGAVKAQEAAVKKVSALLEKARQKGRPDPAPLEAKLAEGERSLMALRKTVDERADELELYVKTK